MVRENISVIGRCQQFFVLDMGLFSGIRREGCGWRIDLKAIPELMAGVIDAITGQARWSSGKIPNNCSRRSPVRSQDSEARNQQARNAGFGFQIMGRLFRNQLQT
jgi:hypothetical protein